MGIYVTGDQFTSASLTHIATEKERFTKISKKAWSIFFDVFNRPDFQKDMNELRQKYGYSTQLLRRENREEYDNWLETVDENIIKEELSKVWTKYNLSKFGVHDVSYEVFIWGNVDMYHSISIGGTCRIVNDGTCNFKSEDFPISIRMTPYVSKSELIDLIEVFYKPLIQPLQNIYLEKSPKIPVVRKRNFAIEKRNRFIVNNYRVMNRRQLVSEVNKKWGSNYEVDLGSVGKVISNWKKMILSGDE